MIGSSILVASESVRQVAKWWMERALVVDRMTGHLGQAALYLQAGIQGGNFEACLQNCDTNSLPVIAMRQRALA